MESLSTRARAAAVARPAGTVAGRGAALRAWLGASATVAAAALLAMAMQRLSHPNLSVVFLCAVLVVAALWGRWPSMYASVLSFLVYNVFFTQPLFTLRVDAEGDVATLIFFLAIAALAGHIAAAARTQMALHRDALRRMSRLFDFTKRMSAASRPEVVADALAGELARELDSRVAVCVANGPAGVESAWAPVQAPGREAAVSAACAVLAGAQRDPAWHGVALLAGERRLGAVCLEHAAASGLHEPLLGNLCDQAAVALERMRLAAELEQARVAQESEQLRGALLASVSHDLRTPLAAITGAASSLLELDTKVCAQDRRELLEGVLAESGRLDRYIQNLLDMTRLGHGAISLRREWVDLADIAQAAAERMRLVLARERIEIQAPEDATLVNVHGALLEQALVNLLDNAARFSPPGEQVKLQIHRVADELCIDVVDRGPGIAPEQRARIFEMFYRVQRTDRGESATGTGLGLAICQGMVGAHGGRVEVLDGDGGRGTRMRIALPASVLDGPGAQGDE
jgi:two-component system sensor histidine kinase KdpD